MRASRLLAIVAACGTLLACAQLVGIGDFPGATSDAGNDVSTFDAPPGTCDTAVLTLSQIVDRVDVSSGFVFVQGADYMARCDAKGSCTDPPNLLQIDPNASFGHASVGSSIAYTVDDDVGGGTVHSMALDGTGDTTLPTSPGLPDTIALSGTSTFWVDIQNDPSTVRCIGCAGADAPWITGVDVPVALFADANSVYVLANDSTNNALGIFGCSASAPCANTPRTVIEGLGEQLTTASMVASDGAAVYVGRLGDIVRVDSNGNVVPVMQGLSVSAIAVDGATHEVAYAAKDGEIGIAPTDGSLARRTLSTCSGSITSLTLDATNVYALIDHGTTWVVESIKR